MRAGLLVRVEKTTRHLTNILPQRRTVKHRQRQSFVGRQRNLSYCYEMRAGETKSGVKAKNMARGVFSKSNTSGCYIDYRSRRTKNLFTQSIIQQCA